ncbi:hypothetical protein AVEN_207762-1 [Araneus ventricosus]|uniref:Uncharacterized protein n=1 Tax=Araneus ventricosus TaxID=182803 RepID=A0A4Y2BZ15_ARAVE|nr:hypothetical protein AVEN_207762-1 [Araneus ventricosus]
MLICFVYRCFAELEMCCFLMMRECGGVDKAGRLFDFECPQFMEGREDGKNRCMRAPPVDSGAAQLLPFHFAFRNTHTLQRGMCVVV